jgi:hypothetical protein
MLVSQALADTVDPADADAEPTPLTSDLRPLQPKSGGGLVPESGHAALRKIHECGTNVRANPAHRK